MGISGSKHIDPDTGLIYFKYDFGYEFGIVLPGETKPGAAKRAVISRPMQKEEGAIDFPVIHETTQKKKPNKVKTVKWEPTSESEMSEIESERIKRVPQTKFNLQTPSPHSRTPSVQSLSPYHPYGQDHTGWSIISVSFHVDQMCSTASLYVLQILVICFPHLLHDVCH